MLPTLPAKRVSGPCRRLINVLLSSSLILLAGCAPLPGLKYLGAYANEEREEKNATAINIDVTSPRNHYFFIGLALSGGGSRAANFSASVLWELHKLGVLRHVQYISAVSGSTLPASYYVLFRKDEKKWNPGALQEAMSQSFEAWVALYALNPVRWPKFLTAYDRTNVLAEVFGNRLLEDRTFGEIPSDSPLLLLNATDAIHGRRFTFTNQSFDALRSDLSRLPVSVGVAASAAFPGALRYVTLRNFRGIEHPPRWDPLTKVSPERYTIPKYLHLVDGGVTDNLGVETLETLYLAYVDTYGGEIFERGCLMIVVDAHVPYLNVQAASQPDTQGIWDIVIDTNALDAATIFMQRRRQQRLEDFGFNPDHWYEMLLEGHVISPQVTSYTRRRPEDVKVPGVFLERARLRRESAARPDEELERTRKIQEKLSSCRVWHIPLSELTHWGTFSEFYEAEYQTKYEASMGMGYLEFGNRLLDVPTRFRISEDDLRNVWTAGKLLVQEPKSRAQICKWLHYLTGNDCRSP
jgi:predicted acylesterase/phospholipase RssA